MIFILNPKFVDEPKYDFIFSTLRNATTLPVNFIKMDDMPRLVKDAFNDYDFVIQSRMDFDDFIFKGAIADTQNKVNECEDILAYGYGNGYFYQNGELYAGGWGGQVGHHSMLQSIILKSSVAKTLPFIGIYNFMHDRLKPMLKDFLEKNGIEFSERMFQKNIYDIAYIYFRHESSHSIAIRNFDIKQTPKQRKITNKDITKKQLRDEFGFTLELKSIKDKERGFDYNFKSIQAEELGFRQDLTSINWVE